jgi:peptidoglycan-N-acetylglucosamine deacetylase
MKSIVSKWSVAILVAATLLYPQAKSWSEEPAVQDLLNPVAVRLQNGFLTDSISSGLSSDKRIALTFDDGPHPVITLKVLDQLRSRNIKATFFVLGERVKLYPEVLQKTFADGHEIGNHTYSHRRLQTSSNEAIESDIRTAQNIIKETIGFEPNLFRPPYGALNPESKRILELHHLQTILWSVDPEDWKFRNEDLIYRFVVQHVRGGSIVLFHDIHPVILDALPRILDTLAAEGYQFTTVSDLCGIPAVHPVVAQVTPSL